MSRCPQILLAVAVAILPLIAYPQAPVPTPPDLKDFRIMLEPRYQGAPVWELIPGAKETGVAAAVIEKNGKPRFLRPEEMKISQIDLAALKRDGLAPIDKLLAALKPKRVLAADGKSYTHYIYHSTNPLTASIALTPKLLDRHKKEFGEPLLLVAPDRFTLVVMPASAEILEGRSDLLATIFDQSVYPISLEVFQRDASGLRVIGNLDGQ